MSRLLFRVLILVKLTLCGMISFSQRVESKVFVFGPETLTIETALGLYPLTGEKIVVFNI